MAIAGLRQKAALLVTIANNLHRERRVVKVNSRPVLFHLRRGATSCHRLAVRQGITRPFRRCARSGRTVELLIGAQGSLRGVLLRQCRRRSVVGAGLPLTLRGPTKDRKGTLARQLWRYAIEQGILPRAPFTVFNLRRIR